MLLLRYGREMMAGWPAWETASRPTKRGRWKWYMATYQRVHSPPVALSHMASSGRSRASLCLCFFALAKGCSFAFLSFTACFVGRWSAVGRLVDGRVTPHLGSVGLLYE